MSCPVSPSGRESQKNNIVQCNNATQSASFAEIPDCLFLSEQCKLYTANLMNKLFENENFDSVNVHFQSNTGEVDSFLSRVMTEWERP